MPVQRARKFVDAYTRDLTSQDVQRLFTRDTPEAYRYFTRGTDLEALAREPWYRRIPTQVRLVFTGFTMRLSPPRRALYGLSVLAVIVGESPLAMKLSDRLFEEGVFAQGIGFPTVARDKARVRTIVTATHTRDELQFALDTFASVGRSLGII